MKTHSLTMTLTPPADATRTERPNPVSARRKGRSAPRNAPATIRQALEIAGEALWVLLLTLVVAFVVAKSPQINAAIDQIGGGAPVPAARAMDASREAQIRDLQERFARYENKLVPLEKGYAQLKQRHADLLKAYSELRTAHVREAAAPTSVVDSHPVAAP